MLGNHNNGGGDSNNTGYVNTNCYYEAPRGNNKPRGWKRGRGSSDTGPQGSGNRGRNNDNVWQGDNLQKRRHVDSCNDNEGEYEGNINVLNEEAVINEEQVANANKNDDCPYEEHAARIDNPCLLGIADGDVVLTVDVEGGSNNTPASTIINIDGLLLSAIVDTGACDSIIGVKWVTRLRMLEAINSGTRRLIDANGKQIPLVGSIEVPVLFGNTVRRWSFWVANAPAIPVILGMNILKEAKIDGPNKIIQIGQDVQPIHTTKNMQVAHVVRAAQDITIPPACSSWVKGRVEMNGAHGLKYHNHVECEGMELSENCNSVDALISVMWESHNEDEVNVPNEIGMVNVEILNESDSPITIPKGEHIAKVLGADNKLDTMTDVIKVIRRDGRIHNKNTMFPQMAHDERSLARHKEKYNELVGQKRILLKIADGSDTQTAHELNQHEGKVREQMAIQSTLQERGDLSEKMAKLSQGCVIEAPLHSIALGSKDHSSYSPGEDNIGTPMCLPRERGHEVLGCMVEEVAPPGLDCNDTISREGKLPEEMASHNGASETADKTAEKEILNKLISEAELSVEDMEQLKNLIENYIDVFANNLTVAGQAMVFPHVIRLNTDVPLWTAQHRRSWKENEVIDEETKKLAEAEVVRQSRSPYNSPVMVVKKKDGGWRTVIDYRSINKITYKEAHPIPRVDEALDALAEAKFITTLDFTSGYWQIPIREKDKHKTAYSTSSGRWEYNVLPMGLTNAPAAFQRIMETVMAGLTWNCCIVYIDDVVIYSKTFAEHLVHLEKVFQRLRAYKICAKPSKCTLVKQEVEYLGHIVGKGMVKPNIHNMVKIREARLPTTVKEIRQFNGMASYYRRFIPGFARIARPLTNLMTDKVNGGRKGGKVDLTEGAIRSYEELKKLLTSDPVLILPDFKKKFFIRTDASKYAVGGVLFQLNDEGEEHPIQYTSRVLTRAETNYSATEREMLGVYYCVRYWRPYVFGTQFVVFSDHRPLKGIKVTKDITGRLARMILKLQEFDFEISYTPGRENGVADALSREPLAGCQRNLHIEECGILAIKGAMDREGVKVVAPEMKKKPLEITTRMRRKFTRGYPTGGGSSLTSRERSFELSDEQLKDSTLDGIRKSVLKKKGQHKKWVFINECLHRVRRDKVHDCDRMQLVVPKKYREEILEANHDDKMGGHLGYWKTLHKITRWYYWPKMNDDIKQWVKQCMKCQQYNGSLKETIGPLQPIKATRPFEIVGMDILTDLPKTPRGNKHILVFTDYFTKWPEAFALPDMEAVTVAKIYVEYIILRHGVPNKIITDRGNTFIAAVFREVTELLNNKHSMTTAYHPQTDGQAERMVGTISKMLGKLSGLYQHDWDSYIPYALYAYRTAVHATTGETPFFLVYGRDEVSPSDARLRQWIEGKTSVHSYAREVIERLRKAREQVIENLLKQKKHNEYYYNKERGENPYRVGDVVWLRVEKQKEGDSRKMKPCWRGPYRIFGEETRSQGMVVDIIHVSNPSDKQRVNVNRLKMAFMRPGDRVADLQVPAEIELQENVGHSSNEPTSVAGENKDSVGEETEEKNKTTTSVENSRLLEEVVEEVEPILVKNPIGRSIYTRKSARSKKIVYPVDQEWEVEVIQNERGEGLKKEYFVKWVGFTERYNSWVSVSNLNAEKLIREWDKVKGRKDFIDKSKENRIKRGRTRR